jgi:MFS family permease
MDAEEIPSPRALYPAYVMAVFGMGLLDVYAVLVPLYGISLGFSPTQVGILIGARSILAKAIAIHAGALMDRFGTRRIMLYVVLAPIMLAPLYAATPNFMALVVLQILCGGAVSLNWLGGQILIAQIGHGEAHYIGVFSFAARVGTFISPILTGVAWDLGGSWLAFGFASLWAMTLFGATLMVPAPGPIADPAARTDADNGAAAPRFRLRDLFPRLSDYTGSFAMLLIPAIAITGALVFARNGTSGIQNSIYVVYLEQMGLTGTMIGLLFSAVEATSGLGSLLGGRAMRWMDPQWFIVICIALALALITITPWIAGVLALLFLAQLVRGLIQGVAQPVMFSIQAKSVGRHQQGLVVGLRQTLNRLAATIVPPLMGVVADLWGIGNSFLIIGAVLIGICGIIALGVRRAPRFEG